MSAAPSFPPPAPVSAPRLQRGTVESFEARAAPKRLRLTSGEAHWIRYVLSDWSGDCGAGSSMGAQLERLAQKPDHAPRRTRADYDAVWRAQAERAAFDSPIGSVWHRSWWSDEQTMYVHAPKPIARDIEAAPERWCAKRLEDRNQIRHAWRALSHLSLARSLSLVVLYALYGDIPPGLPAKGLWLKDVDAEYRRVSRYVPSGGPAADLEAGLQIDRKNRKGETVEARQARIRAAQAERAATLAQIGRECEGLIVRAANDYRGAWREVGQG